MATKYLLDKGHKNILHFAGPDYISSAIERKQGYIKAMKEARVFSEKLIVSSGIKINDEMDTLITRILKESKDIEAVFTYNDIIAFRLLRHARKMKIRIPETVGYDNVQSKIDFGFDITSVNIYKTQMAEKAMSWLFSRIRHQIKNDGFLNEVVPVDLHFADDPNLPK